MNKEKLMKEICEYYDCNLLIEKILYFVYLGMEKI